MERKYSVTGFCPKANKDIKVSATYVFNTNVWKKALANSLVHLRVKTNVLFSLLLQMN